MPAFWFKYYFSLFYIITVVPKLVAALSEL